MVRNGGGLKCIRKVRSYEWLPKEDEWRINIAFNQCIWFPRFMFSYINGIGVNEDFNQEMELLIFETYKNKLSKVDTGKHIQKYLRQFFYSIGFRRKKGTWELGEWTNFYTCISDTIHSSTENVGWIELIETERARRAKVLKSNVS